MIIGGFMLFCFPVSILMGSSDVLALITSAIITSLSGLFLWANTKGGSRKIKKREAYLIVASSYFVMATFGSLPYLLSGTIPDFTNAFFESISGFTTTGASILTDIESTGAGILLWRSLTQWLGGMGIILLTIAILPYFGIGGMELFVAEVPGPTKEKLHPRINETAKRLWFIYVSLTLLLAIVLFIEDMTPFDAINHALTTLSTGGYSTKQSSIGHFSPLIQYTIALFMFIAGMNFTLHYFALKFRFKDIYNNEEFRLYVVFIIVLIAVVTLGIFSTTNHSAEGSFRAALFSVVSIVTTTGYATVDYTAYLPFISLVFFLLLFTGACAGSTSGGIKAIRHLMLVKNGVMEFKRILHPRAMIPVRFNKYVVEESMIYNILAFFVLYMLIFVFSSFVISMTGLDLMTSMSAVATSLGNVGPGVEQVGPSHSFFPLPSTAKWYLGFLMVLGRLELFTVLIIFTPYFWRHT